MLLKYYDLAKQPFGVTPDPAFLFFSPTHREALASVMHGILSGRGFTALIAEPGMGKTTLLFDLLQMLKGTARTAFLFQTLCGPREFLSALLTDLGIEDDASDLTRMHIKLNEYLVRESRQGRQVVVIIDEAQNLDKPVLELIRMLSNFETANKKLMHVVLAGQPQLANKLTSEGLTQLQQRISIVARLAPLNAEETRKYIEHRLHVAGLPAGKSLFTREAFALIAVDSGGIPRNINNLCFNAMSLCCALKRQTVDVEIVQETIEDLDLEGLLLPARKTGRPVFSSAGPRAIFSSAKWQLRATAVAALLVLLGWPAYRAVESKRAEARIEAKSPEETDRRVASGMNQRTSVRDTQTSWQGITIRIQPHDTLSGLGKVYAGRHDAQFLAEVLALNPLLKDPRCLRVGQVVRIPSLPQVAPEIHAAREQNPADLELTAQREKP